MTENKREGNTESKEASKLQPGRRNAKCLQCGNETFFKSGDKIYCEQCLILYGHTYPKENSYESKRSP